MRTALLWLRRDLRLSDHPALAAALEDAERVIPVFCLDRRLLHGRHSSGARTQFLLESLADLDRALRERGSRLVVVEGDPGAELAALAARSEAKSVHASMDVSPYARRRDEAAASALRRAGAALHLHPGLFAVEDPTAVQRADGGPYVVFTPYHRAWLREPRRAPLPPPAALPEIPSDLGVRQLPRLAQLGLEQPLSRPRARGGERAAIEARDAFMAGPVRDYGRGEPSLADPGTSSLSPYLHFGCLSARELEHRLGGGSGAARFRRQLCWREFYAQVLWAFPHNARSEHQPRYRGSLGWSHATERFDAWREGRTGYPIVDAAMRQLREEGWIPNRARLIVGSFLTKDLWIDWRWGERWFMSLLLDGDQANNNGNWQWIASVGVDPQPPARRLYNPVLQQRRHDPDGSYVRRYVPELAEVPEEYLTEPWRMPSDIQAGAACQIGTDYPAPIVEHGEARRLALTRFAVPQP